MSTAGADAQVVFPRGRGLWPGEAFGLYGRRRDWLLNQDGGLGLLLIDCMHRDAWAVWVWSILH